jgi:hypothetical protein
MNRKKLSHFFVALRQNTFTEQVVHLIYFASCASNCSQFLAIQQLATVACIDRACAAGSPQKWENYSVFRFGSKAVWYYFYMSNGFKLALLFATIPFTGMGAVVGLVGLGMGGSTDLVELGWVTFNAVLLAAPFVFLFKKHLLDHVSFWIVLAVLYGTVIYIFVGIPDPRNLLG